MSSSRVSLTVRICLVLLRASQLSAAEIWSLPVPYYGERGERYNQNLWQAVVASPSEPSSYDGFYNNLAHPDWGAADTPLVRSLPPAYADGVYEPAGQNRPNPIDISDKVMGGALASESLRQRTAFLAFFGQLIEHEIVDSEAPSCPPEYMDISVPIGNLLNPANRSDWVMRVPRSRYENGKTGSSPNQPRDQLNEITPYLDGGVIYGPGRSWANALRSFEGGTLASKRESTGKEFPLPNDIKLPMANPPPPQDHYLKEVQRFFAIGDRRGSENPSLLSLNILWYRWHNHLARNISDQLWNAFSDASVKNNFSLDSATEKSEFLKFYDEKIFNEARKWVIASFQKIVMYDWLPAWLGTFANVLADNLPPYKGYNRNVNSQITDIFQAAAGKFGQTLIPSAVFRRGKQSQSEACPFLPVSTENREEGINYVTIRLCNSFWKAEEPITEYDIDEFIRGLMSQKAEREDANIVPDLRGFMYGDLGFSRQDLMAINIQKGRDHGLPDYNTARQEYGLEPVTSWTGINPTLCGNNSALDNSADCQMVRGLREMYGNSLEDMDIWPAGMSETTANGPGELFRTVIIDQFTRIRDGDRFWFENNRSNVFSAQQINQIKSLSLRQIILEVTNITDLELAGDPFFMLTGEEKCRRVLERLSVLVDLTNNAATICRPTNGSTLNCAAVKAEILRRAPNISAELDFYLNCNDAAILRSDPCPSPFVVDGWNISHAERCTELLLYDYFQGSEIAYILTILSIVVVLIGSVALMLICVNRINAKEDNIKKEERAKSRAKTADHEVVEWQGFEEGEREIRIKLDLRKKALLVFTKANLKTPTRTIDSKHMEHMFLKESADKRMNYLSLKGLHDYDLVLKFDSAFEKNIFLESLKPFFATLGVSPKHVVTSQKLLLKQASTKAQRQALLDKFFRVVFKHAFRINTSEGREDLTNDQAKAIIHCELTITEFADALAMKPDSLFVKNMFELIDKDGNGFISFREFLDMIIIFAKGGPEDKAKLLFDMYDVSGTGKLSKADFRTMLKSLMELANTTVDQSQIDSVIDSMFKEANLQSSNESVSLENFLTILHDYKEELSYSQLGFEGTGQKMPEAGTTEKVKTLKRENAPTRARKTVLRGFKDEKPGKAAQTLPAVDIKIQQRQAPKSSDSFLVLKVQQFKNYMEYYRLHVFWIVLYTLILLLLFAEKAYHYAAEAEEGGLRRVAGYGIAVTRGSGSVLMFAYSMLLLTMCRNLITHLRETFLNRFIPFDTAVWFHKYVAYTALIATMFHVVGHSINFYHFSTQSPTDLSCLFRNQYRDSNELPKFHYWSWRTITGFTGMVLTYHVIIMFVFSLQFTRRHLFRLFWITHHTYIILFVFMLLHGSGIVLQEPIFWMFLVGPASIYTFDSLISLSRNKTEIAVTKAELLPSDVTGLTFKRPNGFDYKSGQWVRIACLKLGSNEYHPFTLTSAPHEDHLSLCIRAVGPWTKNLRASYDPAKIKDEPYPKLYLDGPFGEGHQDWCKYEVAVLVGGGIGVTPFASILKDVVHRSNLGARFACRKLYFLWVTRSQKQFEWLVDIIRDVEDKDTKDLISCHIFITQFFQKFDLRTTMLYICERHFQKVSNRSLFTGLKSITHFGRPDFAAFFNSLQDEHVGVSKVGVFSCGPPPMTRDVEETCARSNKERTKQKAIFVHHYENF